MDRESVDKIIENAQREKEKNIEHTAELINAVLDKYDQRKRDPNDEIPEDEELNMGVLQRIYAKDQWYNDHDLVWNAFLQLMFSETARRTKAVKELGKNGLKRLCVSIDPWKTANIKEYYESMYLDSDWRHYDAHGIVICDPSVFISLEDIRSYPSMAIHDIFRKKDATYAIVSDDAPKGTVLRTATISSGQIAIVSVDDILSVPAANRTLTGNGSADYMYLDEFQGEIRYVISQDGEQYTARIEGRGNKNFHTEIIG